MFGKKHAKTTKESTSLPGIDSRAREITEWYIVNTKNAKDWGVLKALVKKHLQAAEADALKRVEAEVDRIFTNYGFGPNAPMWRELAAAIRALKR